MHWACGYIGIPWVFGGRDLKTGFDCWGFFRYVQKKHYALSLPEIELSEYNFRVVVDNFNKNSELQNWFTVKVPKDGDAVLLRLAKYPNHVGLWVKDGETVGVLHAVEKSGVIFSSKQNLAKNRWKIVDYYRHKSKI